MSDNRFGRLYKADERDSLFPMQACLRRKSKRVRRYWRDDYWIGDQGILPHCVGFAWTHWLEAAPVRHIADVMPCVDPHFVYAAAQKVDEWPGEAYDGTSVRAGAKVLKRAGYIKNYHWARNLQDIIQALLEVGPVVVGTAWYTRMNRPKRNGIIRARGHLLGGHAYLLTGVNRQKRLLRIRNSWGPKWGVQGRAYLPFKDMKKLLRMQGEACLAIEIPTEAK